MNKGEKSFFKLLLEEVDVFGKQIFYDENMGSIEEIHDFVKNHINEHPQATWTLIPMVNRI